MATAHFAGRSDDDDDDEGGSASTPQQTNTRPPRHTSSKYDFVKVRVWLGDNSDHYYVLSRFLVSRMLTVTKIPNHVAIKISLELKKLLIDNSLLDVSQTDLEANLFKLMDRRGYGAEYIDRYKMMTRFHHQRVPLIILVCGTACVGKSTIATQLAQRLNLPNVLQTDMVYELLRTATDAPLASTPIWAREFSSTDELVTEFCRECRIVRKGLDGDLRKAMKDGKPVIIEGVHLDPSIYLMDEDNRTSSQKEITGASNEANLTNEVDHPAVLTAENNSVKAGDVESEDASSSGSVHQDGKNRRFLQDGAAGPSYMITRSLSDMSVGPHLGQRNEEESSSSIQESQGVVVQPSQGQQGVETSHPVVEKSSSSIAPIGPKTPRSIEEIGMKPLTAAEQVSGSPESSAGLTVEPSREKVAGKKPVTGLEEPSSRSGGLNGAKSLPARNEDNGKKPLVKTPVKAIVVPIVLRMADIDHQTLLEEWIACRSMDGTGPLEEKEALVSKLRTIQDYLCSFEEQGMKVVNISATTFPQTLDWLHGYLLQCIERGCSPPSPKAGS